MSRIPDFTTVSYGARPQHESRSPEAAPIPSSDAWLTPEGIAVKKAYSGADTARLDAAR